MKPMNSAERAKKWRTENPDRVRELNRANYIRKRSERIKAALDWAERNSERSKRHKRDWARRNSEKKSEYNAAWRSNNRPLTASYRSKRRAAERRATPIWADLQTIKDFYLEAEYFQMEVDHIVPIISPLRQSLSGIDTIQRKQFIGPLLPIVQGFHVEHNMQLLTKAQNVSKGNRAWPDMPGES